jgi:hypothetical protein
MENKEVINAILKKNNMSVEDFKEAKSGFNNTVLLSDNHVLKVMANNEKRYLKELFVYQNNSIKQISTLVDYGTLNNVPCLLMSRGNGKRIYEVWHKVDDVAKEYIIKQIAHLIEEINNIDSKKYVEIFDSRNYMEDAVSNIYANIKKLENIIDPVLKEKILKFLEKSNNVSFEDKNVIVYPDMHFDNILIDDNNNITSIYDFEDIKYCPSFVVLDIFQRMSKYPHLFANEEDEKNVNKKDYENIMIWLRKYNSSLFEYSDLAFKLKLLSLNYDLNIYIKYDKNNDLLKRIMEDIDN